MACNTKNTKASKPAPKPADKKKVEDKAKKGCKGCK